MGAPPKGRPHASRPIAEGAFGIMVAQATQHPDVADGLALAYRSFGPEERRRLAKLVADDGAKHGADPCSALAILLGVEGDPEVARAIAEAMMNHCRLPELGPGRVDTWMGGDAEEGAAAFAESLPQLGRNQVLWVRWGARGLEAGHEPLPSWEEREVVVRGLGLGSGLRRMSRELTIDTLAAVLWSRRRQGIAWPPALARLAGLFGPRAVHSG